MNANAIVERRLHLPLCCGPLGGAAPASKPELLDACRLKVIVRNTAAMMSGRDAKHQVEVSVWSAQDTAPVTHVRHGWLAECLLDVPNNHFVLRMKIVRLAELPGGEFFVASPNFHLEHVDGLGQAWGDVLTSIYALHPAKVVK